MTANQADAICSKITQKKAEFAKKFHAAKLNEFDALYKDIEVCLPCYTDT